MEQVKAKEHECRLLRAAISVLNSDVDSFIQDDKLVAQCLADRLAERQFTFQSGYIPRTARSPLRK